MAALQEAVAAEDGFHFDPSGLVATMKGRPVIATAEGTFLYADTGELIPSYWWSAIRFAYNTEAIPHDDALTIDGKRGVFDPETGNVIDVDGKVLLAGALGGWTLVNYQTFVNQLKKWEPDEKKWYTPLDLIYDELFVRGHTIRNHVGKEKEELLARFDEKPWLKKSTTYNNAAQALIMINAGVFTAKNKGILKGSSAISFGSVEPDKDNHNKHTFETTTGIFLEFPFGWGFYKAGNIPVEYTTLSDGVVVIIKNQKLVSRNRSYFILTSYPAIR